VSAEDRLHAIGVAARLREAGVRTDLALRDASLGRALKGAAQARARVAIVIGERERQEGTLTFRDLVSGEESSMGLAEAVTRLVRRGEPG
jgi:histidyl-tRNA synthetase